MAESAYATSAEHERNTPVSTTTARIELPAAEFAFYDLFERVPDAHVECKPAVAAPDDHALLVVRAAEREGGTVENALRTDPAIEMVECFSEHPDGWTFRVQWDGRARKFVRRLVAADTTLLSAQARNGQWRFRLVAPNRDAFASAYDAIEELGYTSDCRSITTFEGGRAGCSGLTDEQEEALVAAFEAGYYNIPRDVTAEEISDTLDISHQALSERFRRAYGQLVEDALGINGET